MDGSVLKAIRRDVALGVKYPGNTAKGMVMRTLPVELLRWRTGCAIQSLSTNVCSPFHLNPKPLTLQDMSVENKMRLLAVYAAVNPDKLDPQKQLLWMKVGAGRCEACAAWSMVTGEVCSMCCWEQAGVRDCTAWRSVPHDVQR